ncbi:MAG: hypothetical protein ACREBG_26190 [Pyrinomonadaceae bacterium]
MIRPANLTVILIIFAASTLASAQHENLLRNPSGEENAQHWRAFGNATVEKCGDSGSCFVLRDGGYFIQDAVVPEDAVGRYALLIGRARSERTNTARSITGRPALYGYMMNAGDSSGGRIYAYLSGQQMSPKNSSGSNWIHLCGIFRVQPGTRRISFFLRQALQKGIPHDGSPTNFDDLGLYIFPTEQDGLTYVAQRTLTVPLASGKRPDRISECLFQRASIPPLHGIQLGMSLEEILSLFPGAAGQPNVQRALERSKSSDTPGVTRILVENTTNNPDLSEVRQLFFMFRNKQLFSFRVLSSSPQWESVDKFIENRGHLLNFVGVNGWNSVAGNPRSSKYLICDSVEIRFYAAPPGSANHSYISLTDTAVEAAAVSDSGLGRPGRP